MLPSVNENTFRKEVLLSSQPVLVHFWAPWCDLCRMINPMLEQLRSSFDKPVKLVYVNADDNFKLANTYRLRTLPTLLFFEGGSLQKRLDNFQGRDGILALLNQTMNADSKEKNI